MDNQKAIEMIRDDMKKNHDYLSGEYRKALRIAISALEKQIPMEALDPELGISPRHPLIIPCGNCEMELADHMWEYCPWCGQKICWEKE